jgi:cell division protein FtsW
VQATTNTKTSKNGENISVASAKTWAEEAKFIVLLVYIWLAFGLVLLFTSSVPLGTMDFGSPLYFVFRQLLWGALGLGVFYATCRVPLSFWFRWSNLFFFSVLALVVATRFIGAELNGASRWLILGPISIQPSEFAKPALVIHTAMLLERWPKMDFSNRALWIAITLALIGAVLVQPNLSMAVLLSVVLWLMAFIGGLPLSLLLTGIGAGAALAVYKISTTTYQLSRVEAFSNPFAQAQTGGYQLVQSLLAVGSGGWWGTGFGLSQQKANFLPYPYSDFIFAVFAEEFGLIGCLAFLCFLLLFLWSGLRFVLQLSAPKRVRLVAAGATLMMVTQSAIHIAVVIGAIPPTGMPLPLVSYGGSGLVATLLTAGLLVRAAREVCAAPILEAAERFKKQQMETENSHKQREPRAQMDAAYASAAASSIPMYTPSRAIRERRRARRKMQEDSVRRDRKPS